jgi:hypothetical protein
MSRCQTTKRDGDGLKRLRREVGLSSVELAPLTAPHDVLGVCDCCGPIETLSESLPDKCPRTGVVTAGASMYLLQQLVALIPKDAPHEYVGHPMFVEFDVDEDVAGIRNQAFCTLNHEIIQLVKFNSKGLLVKPRELFSPLSSLRIHLSTSTLRHQQSSLISLMVRSVRVSVRLFGFLRDETPRANLTHPASYSLGFARGVSSSLTSSAFKFGYDMCFR